MHVVTVPSLCTFPSSPRSKLRRTRTKLKERIQIKEIIKHAMYVSLLCPRPSY